MERKTLAAVLIVVIFILTSCSPAQPLPPTATARPTLTSTPAATGTPAATATITPLPSPTPKPSPTFINEPGLQVITRENARSLTNLATIRRVNYTGAPFRVAFLPDGSKLVFVYISPESKELEVQLLDGKTGAVQKTFSIPGELNDNWVTADGLRVITCDAEAQKVFVYDTLTGKLESEQQIEGTNRILSVYYNASGTRMALNQNDGPFLLWDVIQGVPITTFRVGDRYRTPGFSPDGRLFMLVTNGKFTVYDAATGDGILQLEGGQSKYETYDIAAYSPSGARFAAADAKGAGDHYDVTIKVWDLHSGKLLSSRLERMDLKRELANLVFSKDEDRLAWTHQADGSLSIEPETAVINVLTGQPEITRWSSYAALTVSPDETLHAYAKENGVIEVAGASANAPLALLSGHNSEDVDGILFSLDGKRILSYGKNSLRLWGVLSPGEKVTRAGLNVVEMEDEWFRSNHIPAGWLSQDVPPRYEIQAVTSHKVLSNCPYTNLHYLTILQVNLTLKMTDLETNQVVAEQAFSGDAYAPCPRSYQFDQPSESKYNGVNGEEVKAWVDKTLGPLGFQR